MITKKIILKLFLEYFTKTPLKQILIYQINFQKCFQNEKAKMGATLCILWKLKRKNALKYFKNKSLSLSSSIGIQLNTRVSCIIYKCF